MDDLTLLRLLDADTPAPTRAALEDAFYVLTDRMDTTRRDTSQHTAVRRRRRNVRFRWGAVATVGTLALVAALTLTDVIGVAGLRGGATAAAAELLDHAATETIHTKDPVVGPGQYREVIFRSVHTVEENGDTNDSGVTVLTHEDRTTWIPADATKPWVQVRYPDFSAGSFGGAEAARAAARDEAAARKLAPQVLRGVNGNFFGGNDLPTPASVNSLPRDPRILLNHIYRVTFGTGDSADGEALVFIADTLNTGFANASLRAALYRAAALIPGVTLTAHTSTLNGRQGIAIGRTERFDGVRQELIIDPTDGSLIGERDVQITPAGVIPAGTTIEWTSATATTVDRIPAAYSE